MHPLRRGFTIVEMLIVIAIICILMAILFPALNAVQTAGKETRCRNNLGQLAKVMQAYCVEHNGSFPLSPTVSSSGTLYCGGASDWLYSRKFTDPEGTGTPSPDSQLKWNLSLGILVSQKYVGKSDIFYCPLDVDADLPRAAATAKQVPGPDPLYPSDRSKDILQYPTSYVINASITYGDETPQDYASSNPSTAWTTDPTKPQAVRSRQWADFEPRAFLFIEESTGVAPDPVPSNFDCASMTPDSTKYALTQRHNSYGYVACFDGHVERMTPDDFKATMTEVQNGIVAPYDAWYKVPGTRWNP